MAITQDQVEALLQSGDEPYGRVYGDGAEIYIGQGGTGPNGTTFYVFVSTHGWEIVRLDKWGGTGTRKAFKEGEYLHILEEEISRIDRRQGHNRGAMR